MVQCAIGMNLLLISKTFTDLPQSQRLQQDSVQWPLRKWWRRNLLISEWLLSRHCWLEIHSSPRKETCNLPFALTSYPYWKSSTVSKAQSRRLRPASMAVCVVVSTKGSSRSLGVRRTLRSYTTWTKAAWTRLRDSPPVIQAVSLAYKLLDSRNGDRKRRMLGRECSGTRGEVLV